MEDHLEKLESMFREQVAQEEALMKEIEDCNKKLDRAGKLINGLEGEKVRWTETVKQYGQDYKLLPGNCLLAAGMVSYAGPFTSAYRTTLEDSWRDAISKNEISLSEGITMMQLLEDKVQTKVWTAAQLPSDQLSI